MKRLTCEVKGQIGVNEVLRETRVARLAECRLKQKVGYDQHTSPFRTVCRPVGEKTYPKILKVLWEMKKNGKAKDTIKNVAKALKVLAKNCDLDNPDSVKTFIAVLDRKNGYKRQLCYSYNCYVKVHNLRWTKPKYYVPSKMPKIPLEAKIDLIISKASPKLALAISMSKDTGLRPIELMNLKLKDIDLTKGAVYPETAKHGSPRVLKLSNSTLKMLNKWLARKNLGINDKIFTWWNNEKYGQLFRIARNKVAKKMCD